MRSDIFERIRSRPDKAIFIGIVFFGVGLLLACIVYQNLHGYWRTRNKVTAEAQIQSFELQRVTRGSDPNHAVIWYEYCVDGRFFTGSKIALFKDPDDPSDQSIRESLESAWRARAPIRVYIDPERPSFSVIDRDFKWWPFAVSTLAVGAFAAAGFYSLTSGLRVIFIGR